MATWPWHHMWQRKTPRLLFHLNTLTNHALGKARPSIQRLFHTTVQQRMMQMLFDRWQESTQHAKGHVGGLSYFWNMLDVSCKSAFALWLLKNPEWKRSSEIFAAFSCLNYEIKWYVPTSFKGSQIVFWRGLFMWEWKLLGFTRSHRMIQLPHHQYK